MKFIFTDGRAEFEFLGQLKKRAGEAGRETEKTVRDILDQVREEGDRAIRRFGMAFDGACPESFLLPQEEMKKAFEQAEPGFRRALLAARANIEEFHKEQQVKDYEIKKGEGVRLGMVTRGMDRVGIYVPGGTAAYPSTVLMNSIPARLAGVGELVMVTPPAVSRKEDGTATCGANPHILAAAYAAGVDRILLAGGAQAVAGLAYGTESFPRVDKIVGPGNLYVATAKRLLYGQVDIDMIAGPSEILILADDTARPEYIAADLLSQAEHDRLAAPILITDCERIGHETVIEVKKQAEQAERNEIILDSLANFGAVLVCRSPEEMAALADLVAPEHLEIMTKDPMAVMKQIRNAGSVFLGDYSPEPLGDYYSGANHVLPTSGTARFSSPLGVYSFVKRMSYTWYSKEALADAREDIAAIADREGLFAHRRAVDLRFEKAGE